MLRRFYENSILPRARFARQHPLRSAAFILFFFALYAAFMYLVNYKLLPAVKGPCTPACFK
jgi:hypothetical protein